ncbi:hypothetical protein LCGC14_0432850 [marine sediment metagenome]|uniref:Uncharacterized protein n=1 Tax=marine sediment metagenome TaxID=412755 RepID=A0A0F9SMN2_9ZZZZ
MPDSLLSDSQSAASTVSSSQDGTETQSGSGAGTKTDSSSQGQVVFEAPDRASIEVGEGDSSTPDNSKWYWADGVEGSGEPPAWWNKEKYKYVADQAAAHPELRKKLGAFTGAPEEYKYNVTAEGLKDYEVDPENNVIKALSRFAKDNNMSQDGFSDLLNGLVMLTAQDDQASADEDTKFYAEQEKLLGENSEQRRADLSQWAKQQNFEPHVLEAMGRWAQTANDVIALEAIKQKSGYASVTATEYQPSSSMDTFKYEEELRTGMADKRYGRDSEYTQEFDKNYKDYYSKKFEAKT